MIRSDSIIVDVLLTSGKHALNKVGNITQDNSIAFGIGFSLRPELLNLNALEYWYWELLFQSGGLIEYGTENISGKLEFIERKMYLSAPVVI